MNKWTLVNPLVSNINDENMSIVSNDSLHAAKVLYERLSKNFDKDVNDFRFTVKRTAVPKHMEHTGGYGEDSAHHMVGGGNVNDYFSYRITETRQGKQIKFDIEKETVRKKKLQKFIKELDKYDNEFNAYSPNNPEFDEFSLDFSLNDSSIQEIDDKSSDNNLHSVINQEMGVNDSDNEINKVGAANNHSPKAHDSRGELNEVSAANNYSEDSFDKYLNDNSFDDLSNDKYSPQFDQFGGGKKRKKRDSDDSDDSDDSISSSSSDSDYLRRSKPLTTYVNDFTPTRVWVYHPYLYKVSKIIVPSFNISELSPYFYVSLN